MSENSEIIKLFSKQSIESLITARKIATRRNTEEISIENLIFALLLNYRPFQGPLRDDGYKRVLLLDALANIKDDDEKQVLLLDSLDNILDSLNNIGVAIGLFMPITEIIMEKNQLDDFITQLDDLFIQFYELVGTQTEILEIITDNKFFILGKAFRIFVEEGKELHLTMKQLVTVTTKFINNVKEIIKNKFESTNTKEECLRQDMPFNADLEEIIELSKKIK